MIGNFNLNLDNLEIWKNKDFDLPIYTIDPDFLKFDIKDQNFHHLIAECESEIGLKLPHNQIDFYPIFELFILNKLTTNQDTLEYIKLYKKDGQKDPIILSFNNSLIDGNKRLAAIKLANIIQKTKFKNEENGKFLVKIIVLPNTLYKKEILELKTKINFQADLGINKDLNIKKLKALQNLYSMDFEVEKIQDMLGIDIKKISFYQSILNLIEEFLIELDSEGDYYLIERFGIFHHFEVLNKELINLGANLGKKGSEIINLKDSLKNLVYIWLKISIEENITNGKKIFKSGLIRKLKYAFVHPERYKLIRKILENEITNNRYINSIIKGIIININITEEKRTWLEHIKMLEKRVKYIKYKLDHISLLDNEKEILINTLSLTQKSILELIENYQKT